MIHPEVTRRIWVPAELDAVEGQLRAYSDLHSPKHASSQLIRLAARADHVEVLLPRALHPWTFHNVAFWLADTPGARDDLVASSDAAPTHPAYRLGLDPEMGDCLCGVDDDGQGWTVLVPTNDVVRGDPTPLEPRLPPPSEVTGTSSVEVLVEDPGRDMNPTNEATAPSRKRLERLYVPFC